MQKTLFFNWNQGELLQIEYFLPLILIFFVASWWDRARRKTKLDVAFSSLRSMLILYVGLLLYFLLELPTFFIVDNSTTKLDKLSTSTIPPELLVHLRESNSALVRLLQIVHWYLFFTCAWFIAGTYQFLRVLKETKGDTAEKSA